MKARSSLRRLGLLTFVLLAGCLEERCWQDNPVADPGGRRYERWTTTETPCASDEDCAGDRGALHCYLEHVLPDGSTDPESPWRFSDGTPAPGTCGCAFPQHRCDPWRAPYCAGGSPGHLDGEGEVPRCEGCLSDVDCDGVTVALYESPELVGEPVGEIALSRCDLEGGQCVECLEDSDCPLGRTCNRDLLRCQIADRPPDPLRICDGCESDEDCGAGTSCASLGSTEVGENGESVCLAIPTYSDASPETPGCPMGYFPSREAVRTGSGLNTVLCVPNEEGALLNGPISCEARQAYLRRQPCAVDADCGAGGICHANRCTLECMRPFDCLGVGFCDLAEGACVF